MSSTYRPQRGVTVPELMIVVVTAGVLAAAAAKTAEYAVRSNNAVNLGTQGAAVYDSLQNYVATHIDTLINGAAVPGVSVPLAPTEAEMRALGYATFSTSSTAGAGITWNYTLTLSPPGCIPQTCNVLVYVGLSGAPRIKDNTVDMHLVAEAAQESGRPAGFSSLESPSVISGLGGSWTLPNPMGNAPGILGLYGSYGGGQFGNYVRLGDTRPITLNSTLAVGGNLSSGANINAVGTITADRDVAVGRNLSVTTNANIGGNATVAGEQSAVRGQSRLWRSSNGLVNSTADNSGVTMHQEMVFNGRQRWVNSAFTKELGSLDQAGNWSTAGVATNNGINANGQINALNGRVKIASAAWAGAGCSEGNGTITTDPNGRVLSCQGGTWQTGSKANIIFRAGAQTTGQSVAYCAANETMVAGMCDGVDVCSGSDTSTQGGFPVGNGWACRPWHCTLTTAYVSCMQ